jgi:hypothetical protein
MLLMGHLISIDAGGLEDSVVEFGFELVSIEGVLVVRSSSSQRNGPNGT